MPKPRVVFVVLLLPLLETRCHLLDQRDFDANAGRPPAPPRVVAAAGAAAPALVTIRYTTPDPQYREALTGAVKRALARKPDVLFTVTTLVPGIANPDEQAASAADASSSGRMVAQAIVDDGAEPGQVEQDVRVQPGLAAREVRVTVQ